MPRHPPNALTSLTTGTVEPLSRFAGRWPSHHSSRARGLVELDPTEHHARSFIRRPNDACSISLDFTRCSTINHLQNAIALLLTFEMHALVVCISFVLRTSFIYSVVSETSIQAGVGQERFELSTPRLSSVCSNQLSYWPAYGSVSQDRIASHTHSRHKPQVAEV